MKHGCKDFQDKLDKFSKVYIDMNKVNKATLINFVDWCIKNYSNMQRWDYVKERKEHIALDLNKFKIVFPKPAT